MLQILLITLHSHLRANSEMSGKLIRYKARNIVLIMQREKEHIISKDVIEDMTLLY